MNKTDRYIKFEEQFSGKVKKQVFMAPYTTYKIGGPADLFIEAKTPDDFAEFIKAARGFDIPIFILGGGSNILISDSGFRGLVIRNVTSAISLIGMKGKMTGTTNERVVYVGADSGVVMNALVRFTLDEGLAGLEMHLGLPGTVGGALFMNSKWMKPPGFVGDVLYQAMILTPQNEIKIVPKQYFQFSYGKSNIQKTGDILLTAVFALKKFDNKTLWNIANESISYRRDTQPQGVATAGCVFKNLSTVEAVKAGTPDHTTSVGKLLDLAGLKGKTIGGCQYSMKHANFIINTGIGTSNDMIQLIALGKEELKKKFNVILREEIQIIGENP